MEKMAVADEGVESDSRSVRVCDGGFVVGPWHVEGDGPVVDGHRLIYSAWSLWRLPFVYAVIIRVG